MSDPHAPAGWYPDPTNEGKLRRWDGTGWTDDFAAETPLEPAEPSPPEPNPKRRPTWLLPVVAVAVLGLGAVAVLGATGVLNGAPAGCPAMENWHVEGEDFETFDYPEYYSSLGFQGEFPGNGCGYVIVYPSDDEHGDYYWWQVYFPDTDAEVFSYVEAVAAESGMTLVSSTADPERGELESYQWTGELDGVAWRLSYTRSEPSDGDNGSDFPVRAGVELQVISVSPLE